MDNICLLIFCIGDIPYKKKSLLVIQDYFSTFGVDIKLVEDMPYNPKGAHPSWLKLLCHDICEGKDFILNYDLDLLPTRGSRLVLNDLDFSKLNMCMDSSLLYGRPGFNKNFKYNGGLIGVPSGMSSFCKMVYQAYAPGSVPSYEQYYLNDTIALNDIPVHELDPKFNMLFVDYGKNGRGMFESAYYKHYTLDCIDNSKRVKEINEHFWVYFEPWLEKYRACYRNRVMGIDLRHVVMLKDIVESCDFKHILEIGVFDGASSSAILEASNKKEFKADFCDIHFTPTFHSLCEEYPSDRFSFIPNPSHYVIDSKYDMILVDGDHSVACVTKEVDMILKAGTETVISHDTYTGKWLPNCDGPMYLNSVLLDNGYKKVEDCKDRTSSGEDTRRGFSLYTKSDDVFNRASSSIEKYINFGD